MTNEYQLTPSDVEHLQSVVNFCKPFAITVLKLTNSVCVGIDETPTLAVFIESTQAEYGGPDIFLNRLKVLDSRIQGNGTISLRLNDKGVPVELEMNEGRKQFNFRLGSIQRALPNAFTGSFVHMLEITRADFCEMLTGSRAIGGETITIEHKDGRLTAKCSKEGEHFKYTLQSKTGLDVQYSFNYSTQHLATVEKLMPPNAGFIGNITPRGQMMVELVTAEVTAKVFILDIKNR